MADETQKIVFRGLNADETYQLEFEDHPEQNCAVLGQTLMTEGIEVKLTESIDSEIIWIKSAN